MNQFINDINIYNNSFIVSTNSKEDLNRQMQQALRQAQQQQTNPKPIPNIPSEAQSEKAEISSNGKRVLKLRKEFSGLNSQAGSRSASQGRN